MKDDNLRFTVYLRTSLFSFGGPEAHVPPSVQVVEGEIVDRFPGGFTILTSVFRDVRGREIAGNSVKLQLPWAKVDHIQLHEA